MTSKENLERMERARAGGRPPLSESDDEVFQATLKDHKGRIWTEALETAVTPNKMPVWTLEGLRLENEPTGWVLTTPLGTEHASGKAQIHEAISFLERQITKALGEPFPAPITDREGRIWTHSETSDGTKFWFTLATFEGHKREVRLVRKDTMWTLGIVGHKNHRGTFETGSIATAIDVAAREFLPKEPKTTEPEEATMARKTYEDSAGRTWVWSPEQDGEQDYWWTTVLFGGKGYPAEIRMTRSEYGWILEGCDPDPVPTHIITLPEAVESVRERIDTVTRKDAPVSAQSSAQAAQEGIWLVVDQYTTIRVVEREIDALRAVNEALQKSETELIAWFVPYGSTLADVRGH